MEKYCPSCKEVKRISEFNKNKKRKDGHQGFCKICSRSSNERYHKSPKGIITQRQYEQTQKYKIKKKSYDKSRRGKDARDKAMRKYKFANANKVAARTYINNLIASRVMENPYIYKCFYCKHDATEYHHYRGYAPENWIFVIPVCHKCHRNLHRKYQVQ